MINMIHMKSMKLIKKSAISSNFLLHLAKKSKFGLINKKRKN